MTSMMYVRVAFLIRIARVELHDTLLPRVIETTKSLQLSHDISILNCYMEIMLL